MTGGPEPDDRTLRCSGLCATPGQYCTCVPSHYRWQTADFTPKFPPPRWPDATACLKHISTLWFEPWFEVPHQDMPALLSGARRPVHLPAGWPPASSTTTEEAITTDAEAVTPMEAGAINATEADATAVEAGAIKATETDITAIEAGKYRYRSFESKAKPYQADVEAALQAAAARAAEITAAPQPEPEPEHAGGAVGLLPRESLTTLQFGPSASSYHSLLCHPALRVPCIRSQPGLEASVCGIPVSIYRRRSTPRVSARSYSSASGCRCSWLAPTSSFGTTLKLPPKIFARNIGNGLLATCPTIRPPPRWFPPS